MKKIILTTILLGTMMMLLLQTAKALTYNPGSISVSEGAWYYGGNSSNEAIESSCVLWWCGFAATCSDYGNVPRWSNATYKMKYYWEDPNHIYWDEALFVQYRWDNSPYWVTAKIMYPDQDEGWNYVTINNPPSGSGYADFDSRLMDYWDAEFPFPHQSHWDITPPSLLIT
jgi:hypothetical protein